MSVIVKNLEMPENCHKCMFYGCKLWRETEGYERHPDCPLMEMPKRKAGHWIVKHTPAGRAYTVCSVCKIKFTIKTEKGTIEKIDMRGSRYCPSCGARMVNNERKL